MRDLSFPHSRAHDAVNGMEIRTSAMLVVNVEVGYPDWRARLHRNMTGPTLRPLEPLTYWRTDPDPNMYQIAGVLYGHPATVEVLRKAIAYEGMR